MRILFTTPVLENPPAGGPQLRIENSIKALNEISELHIISRVSLEKIGGFVADKFYRKHCKRFLYSSSAKNFELNKFLYRIKKFLNILRHNKKKYEYDRYIIESDATFILNYAKKNAVDLIWFGYGNQSYDLIKEIKNRNSSLPLICDTDSVLSRYLLRGMPYEKCLEKREKLRLFGKKQEKEEAELVKLCDATLAVSEVDAEYYRELADKPEKIKIFSNVIDVNDYSISQDVPKNFKKPCIYLAGSFGFDSPMNKATMWFVEKVFPLVKKEIENIHFYIIGNRSDSTLGDIKSDSISVVGKVKSVLPYLQNATVAIVPLMFESGTRFKILEAAACGIPIVSTTLGAEGLAVVDREDILIADEPREFADAILKLIKDEDFAKKIANNCKQLVKKKYGLEKLIEEGKEVLDFIKKNRDHISL